MFPGHKTTPDQSKSDDKIADKDVKLRQEPLNLDGDQSTTTKSGGDASDEIIKWAKYTNGSSEDTFHSALKGETNANCSGSVSVTKKSSVVKFSEFSNLSASYATASCDNQTPLLVVS